MNKEFLHKIISIWIAIIAILPMSVQFAHSLEDHSHDICEENNIQHFHKHQIECESDHYLVKLNAVSITEIIKSNIVAKVHEAPNYFTNFNIDSSFLKLNSRGPPYATI